MAFRLLGRCGHCNNLAEVEVDLGAIIERLDQLGAGQEQIVTALDNLKAADEALKAEVTTFLTDVAGRLSGSSDAEVQAVADDINAEVAALHGGDPANAPAPAAPVEPVAAPETPPTA